MLQFFLKSEVAFYLKMTFVVYHKKCLAALLSLPLCALNNIHMCTHTHTYIYTYSYITSGQVLKAELIRVSHAS